MNASINDKKGAFDNITSSAHSNFNCYGHWSTLVVRETRDGSGKFLHSKEGVTQGDPLTMISYGIGVSPLIRELQGATPRVTQLWYADDAGSGRKFTHILAHFWDLQTRGPPRSYFPDPTKSTLVVALRNVALEEEYFRGTGIKVVTVNRYLGGFIGESEAEKSWLAGNVAGWEKSVDTFNRVFPQAPAFHICLTAEVTPEGVEICAADYSGHRRRLWPSREGAAGDFLAGAI